MNSRPSRQLLGGLAVVIFVASTLGCGYGPVSMTGYEYAKAMYSMSNRQSSDRIDAVEAQIDDAVAAGDLPPHEAAWLRDITRLCREGQWETAQKAARRMMQDQVGRRTS